MMFSLNVFNREGAIKMTTEFIPNCAGDITMNICKEKENLKESSSTWTFVNKLSVVLYPSRVFNDKISKGRSKNTNIWQPETLFFEMKSSSGCAFNIFFLLPERSKRKLEQNKGLGGELEQEL